MMAASDSEDEAYLYCEYPRECLACLEVVQPGDSYASPCCMRPVCWNCVSAVLDQPASFSCPHCGATNNQLVDHNNIIRNLLVDLRAKATSRLRDQLKALTGNRKKLLRDQGCHQAIVAKILPRINRAANAAELLSQCGHHDKNFLISLEALQTRIKQLQGALDYLHQDSANLFDNKSTDSVVLTVITRLAYIKARLRQWNSITAVLNYNYQPVSYNYHPLGSSIGCNHIIEKLTRVWRAEVIDKSAQPDRTIATAQLRPDDTETLGSYCDNRFGQCRCNKITQIVEHRYYYDGVIIVHYEAGVTTEVKLLYPPDHCFFRCNCRWLICSQMVPDPLDSRGRTQQQFSLWAIADLLAGRDHGIILLPPQGDKIMDLTILQSDRILAITGQGLVCYDLTGWGDENRQSDQLTTLPGRLVLARTRIVQVEACGIYLVADNNEECGQAVTVATQSPIYYDDHSIFVGLEFQFWCSGPVTGFGQIDPDSLSDRDKLAIELFPVQNVPDWQKSTILADGSVICQVDNTTGSIVEHHPEVWLWTDGQFYRQAGSDLVNLVDLNCQLTQHGEVMVLDDDATVIKFYGPN